MMATTGFTGASLDMVEAARISTLLSARMAWMRWYVVIL